MSQRTHRSTVLFASLLVAAFALFGLHSLRAGEHGGEGEPPALALPRSVEVLLLRAGLSPQSLATAGVSGTTLAARLGAGADALLAATGSLAEADAACAALRVERDRLQRVVRSGQDAEGDPATLAALQTSLATAEAARKGVLDGVFQTLSAELSQGQRASLTQLRANERWRVPVQYRVVERSQSGWVRLRELLAHVRTYTANELEPRSGLVSELAALDQEELVAAAAASLATHIGDVQARWSASFVQ